MWCSAFSLAICYYSIPPQRSCRSKPWSPGVKLCPRFGNRFMGTPSKSPPLEFFSVQIRIPKPAIYETIQSQPLAAGWHHLIEETTYLELSHFLDFCFQQWKVNVEIKLISNLIQLLNFIYSEKATKLWRNPLLFSVKTKAEISLDLCGLLKNLNFIDLIMPYRYIWYKRIWFLIWQQFRIEVSFFACNSL